MSTWALRDRTCIVGVGNTAYGSFPDTDTYGLGSEALSHALADAGIGIDEVDGLITSRIPAYDRFAETIGINPRFSLHLPTPGRFSAIALMLAAQVLAAGEAEVIALVYGNNGRSVRVRYGGDEGLWAPWGMTSPGAIHALMFRHHMDRFGTTSEQLANVGITFRQHAALNPQAVKREPYGLDDHQLSRFIVEPLHLLDYCLINDGGVAWIMTTAERAKHMKKPPVYVSGFARQDTLDHASLPDLDFWYPALRSIASQVYERAGISRDDIDGLLVYDNFSPTVLFSLEGMGFCDQGEGGDFVSEGHLALGSGRLPTNTNGGHLSESYMQGWALINEGVRQLRGECGQRQIPECHAMQYICATNSASSVILRR